MAASLIGDRYRSVDRFEPLLDMLTAAYLAGMAHAGWTHGHDDVRTAAALTAPGRFLGVAAGLPGLAADQDLLAAICARAQWEPDEFLARMAEFVLILTDTSDRAVPLPWLGLAVTPSTEYSTSRPSSSLRQGAR